MTSVNPESLLRTPSRTGYRHLAPKTKLGRDFARLQYKRFYLEFVDVLGDQVNGAVLLLENSDFAYWGAVVMCLSFLSFLYSIYKHRSIQKRRMAELEEKYEELSDLDKYRYKSEAWYTQVKD